MARTWYPSRSFARNQSRPINLVVQTINPTVPRLGQLFCAREHSARCLGLYQKLDRKEGAAALIAHPAVRRINFNGSTKVGKIIAKLAAEHLKPTPFESGGEAPLLILDLADLNEAVAAAAFGAFMNS